ncbi:Protein kinase-like domain containing protein [Elaphomyces granulatus]
MSGSWTSETAARTALATGSGSGVPDRQNFADLAEFDYGDFVDSDGECEVEELSEEPKDYALGYYYPICIGDVLNKTYRLEHKLGHGNFSTVWLARDISMEKYVALKIISPGKGENEYNMQNEIKRTVQDTSNILMYQTTFFLPGDKGNYHRVLVYHLLKQLSVATRMSAARPLLMTLERLHNAGIVHQHLTDRNVMLDIATLDNLDTKTKYKCLGRPKKVPLSSRLWKRGELVKPMEVPKNLLRETVYLGGFGRAIKADTEVELKVLYPFVYCAPERFHNMNPSFASDIWSYMCLFTSLYLGLVPWNSTGCSSLMNNMVKALGLLPRQWMGRYKAFNSDPGNNSCQSTRELVLSILVKGLSYLPENRWTATELLQDAAFKAVMEIYCC